MAMPPWEMRIQQLSKCPRLQTEIIGRQTSDADDAPLYALTFGESGLPSIVVAAGVHGDEPEAVEAALQLLEEIAQGATPVGRHRLVVLPCLNPSGVAGGTRANRLGQDINRQFHSDLTQVTTAVRRFLPSVQTEMLIDLHADRTTQGFYFFELLQPSMGTLAPAVQQALMQAGFTLEAAPFYAGCVGKQGLIAPTRKQMAGFERVAVGASLAQWAWQIGVPRSYAFETPQSVGEEAGVEMHLTALRALFAALEAGP